MSNDTTDTFEGSGPELHSMTREFDELHHDVGMPAMPRGRGRDPRDEPPHLPHGCGRTRSPVGRPGRGDGREVGRRSAGGGDVRHDGEGTASAAQRTPGTPS